jgi:release factor glutamine methyltransferase
VLDPRPETEVLVGWALERGFRRALDLGVGSGCILLTLLAERPEATGEGVDASPAALAVARENAARLGVADRATLRRGDWLEGAAPADLVLANPPYLDAADMRRLSPETAREPRIALDGGADGLDAYRRIAARLPDVLRAEGEALFEVGAGQADAVANLLREAGFGRVDRRSDLDGRERVVRARP